jgi:hypothetical protein
MPEVDKISPTIVLVSMVDKKKSFMGTTQRRMSRDIKQK